MKRFLTGLAVLVTACGSAESPADDAPVTDAAPVPQRQSSNAASADNVAVNMEGARLAISQVDWQVSRIETIDGELRYELRGAESPLTLNLNVRQDAVPTRFPATFTVPDDNIPSVRIDLNLFNRDRDSRRLQKRIIFSGGTINVRAMGPDGLDISFSGSGHPLMANSEIFPIEGHATVVR